MTDDRPVPARPDVNVTDVLGAEERGTTVDEHLHARRGRVSVAVALPGTRDGELGPQGGDLSWREGLLGPMVTDLEQVDVSHVPSRDARPRLVALRIAGQQRREPPPIALVREQQLDGVGVGRARHGHARPDHLEHHGTGTERIPIGELGRRRPREPLAGTRQLFGQLTQDPLRHDDPVAADGSHECGDSPVVVVVQVRHHNRVKVRHMGPGQGVHHRITRTRIDEQGMAAVLHEDRVALADVEHDDARGSQPPP